MHDDLLPNDRPVATVGTWECDLETDTLTWSHGVYDIFGIPRGTLTDRASTLQLYQPDSRVRLEALRTDAIRARACFSMEARIVTQQGEPRWMRLIADVERDPRARARIYGVKQDITAEKIGWDRLRAKPEHDPVTGLAGVDLFRDLLHGRTRGGGWRTAAVILIEIDRFASIVDRHGEAAADECLRQSAVRLSRAFLAAGLIARTDTARLAVLLRIPIDPPALIQSLERAVMALQRPVAWGKGWISLGVAIGAAIAPRIGTPDPAGLSDEAETALLSAQLAGRGAIRVFGSSDFGLPTMRTGHDETETLLL